MLKYLKATYKFNILNVQIDDDIASPTRRLFNKKLSEVANK